MRKRARLSRLLHPHKVRTQVCVRQELGLERLLAVGLLLGQRDEFATFKERWKRAYQEKKPAAPVQRLCLPQSVDLQ
jgi:hypothetical protein